VIELLFERGQFDEEATQRTSSAVLYYVLGLPGLAAAFFLRNAYLALDRSWSLCWLSLLSWVGAWFLNVVFGAYWGVPGVAAATAVIATATSAGMIVHLASRCEVDLGLSESWLPVALMTGLSIGASVLVAGGYALGLAALDSSGLFARLCVLGLVSIFALVAYVAAARMALLSEAIWLVRRLQAIRAQVASR
jgi:putative peptidoglycan lipid II flippase